MVIRHLYAKLGVNLFRGFQILGLIDGRRCHDSSSAVQEHKAELKTVEVYSLLTFLTRTVQYLREQKQ